MGLKMVSRITTLLACKRPFHWIWMKSRLVRAVRESSNFQNLSHLCKTPSEPAVPFYVVFVFSIFAFSTIVVHIFVYVFACDKKTVIWYAKLVLILTPLNIWRSSYKLAPSSLSSKSRVISSSVMISSPFSSYTAKWHWLAWISML